MSDKQQLQAILSTVRIPRTMPGDDDLGAFIDEQFALWQQSSAGKRVMKLLEKSRAPQGVIDIVEKAFCGGVIAGVKVEEFLKRLGAA